MRSVLPLMALVAIAGCATIANGRRQPIGIASAPAATILVDGVRVGVTPIVLELARRRPHVVRLELDGYEPLEIRLDRKVSSFASMNFFNLGVGLAVDAATGGLYTLTPDQVAATMKRRSDAPAGEGLWVDITTRPDPAWRRAGSLSRIR
jgi:hypothetical protein